MSFFKVSLLTFLEREHKNSTFPPFPLPSPTSPLIARSVTTDMCRRVPKDSAPENISEEIILVVAVPRILSVASRLFVYLYVI